MEKPRLSYRHVMMFEFSRGRVDPSNDQAGFLKLTTTGRKSGQQRTVHLLYIKDSASYVVSGSNGGKKKNPGWYYNVRDNPEVTFEVRGQQKKAIAEIPGPEKRSELWAKLVEIAPMYGGYTKRAGREIPMVILRPVEG